MGNIWGNDGKLIGSTKTDRDGVTKAYDKNGQPKGTTNDLGTWGNNSKKVTTTKDPGLLFGK